MKIKKSNNEGWFNPLFLSLGTSSGTMFGMVFINIRTGLCFGIAMGLFLT